MSSNIFDWLDSVNAQAANADPPPSRKRDRIDDHNGSLLTPEAKVGPATMDAAATSSSPAKRRETGIDTAIASDESVFGANSNDQDVTPKVHNPLIPPALRDLVQEFESVSAGATPFISSAFKPEFSAMAGSPSVRAIAEGMFTDVDKRGKLGAPVKLADVLELIKKAARCLARSQNEAGWNLLVHMPLLQLAVHGGMLSSEGLVQAEPCTTAAILAEYYRRPLTSSRKIDFVMVP
ncbi:hypothetical protein RB597_008990 [Gaeumannomyces tritici]